MSARARLALLALAAATLAGAVLPSASIAAYDNGFDESAGAFLISADYGRLEQGDDTTRYAAISADGHYVALETFSRNFFADDDPDPPGRYRAGGIFRFDLENRSLEKVADGNVFDESSNDFVRRGASNPSISADGRFIAFSTAQALVPADDNENVDVYVRDMAQPLPPGGTCAGDPCPFELVSARDGGDLVASYGASPLPGAGGAPGASVSRGVAISADGRRVAFRTEAGSDLPALASVEAPPGQIYVRDLDAETTTLVTANREPGTGAMTSQAAGGALGAAISADGDVVAWTGGNAAAQAPFLAGENSDPSFYYYLWRHAPFGASDPTRRITGVSDPEDPACRSLLQENPELTLNFDSVSSGPCYGPLTDQEGFRSDISGQLPALSADGETVAFLTGSGPRPINSTGPGLDLFLTRMSPGLTRKAATTELTRDTSSFEPAVSAPIGGVTISPDGRYIAITTSRTQFSLPVLHMVGEPRSVAGPHELYLIDLAEHTIERAVHSTSGGDINGEVQDGPTLDADAGRIAFTSFAGNLFFGDANQRTDAFVVTRETEPVARGEEAGRNGGTSTIEEFGNGPHISAQVKSVKGGVAVLLVSVPEAGRLRAVATARVDHAKQVVATGKTTASGRAKVRMTLGLGSRFRKLLGGGGKLVARAVVTFTPLTPGKHLKDSAKISY